jgi:hypothetical protein
LKKLPGGYTLKSTANHFWVDGCCRYQVANGNTEKKAIQNALKAICREKTRLENGGVGKAAWFVQC